MYFLLEVNKLKLKWYRPCVVNSKSLPMIKADF